MTELQKIIVCTMHKYDQMSGRRMSYSAVDLSDRGVECKRVASLGTTMKALVKKGFLEMTALPSAKKNCKAKYKLTQTGRMAAIGLFHLYVREETA